MSGIVVNKLVTDFEFRLLKGGVKTIDKSLDSFNRKGIRIARDLDKNISASVRNMVKNFGFGLKSIQRQADGLKLRARVHVDNSQAKASIREVQGVASGLQRSLSKLTLGLGGGLAVAGGAKEFTKRLYDAVGTKQQQMGRLTTQFNGDKAQAAAMYKWMKQFGEETPFSKDELINGFSTIKGSGYQMSADDMRGLGDVTSGSSKNYSEMIEMLKSVNRGRGDMVDNFDGMKATARDGIVTMQRFDKHLNQWISKDIEAGNIKEFVAFVRAHGERNYKGEMERQSKTLPGLMSTFWDRVQSRFEDVGDGGMEKKLTQGMNFLLKWSADMEPRAKALGKSMAELIDKGMVYLPGILKNIKTYGPTAVKVFGGLYLGSKIIGPLGTAVKLIGGLGNGILALRGLPALVAGKGGIMAILSGGFSAAATAATPFLIGGAVLLGIGALAGLVYKVADYWQNGDKALAGMKEKFPWIADGVKSLGDGTKAWWPHLKVAGNLIKTSLEGGFKLVIPIAKELFYKVIEPGLGLGIRLIGDFFKGMKIIYEAAMPAMVKAFYWWKSVLAEIFDWALPKLEKIQEAVQETGGAVNAKTGLGPLGGAPLPKTQGNEQGRRAALLRHFLKLGYDPDRGDKLGDAAEKEARRLNSTGYCATGVNWTIYRVDGKAQGGDGYQIDEMYDGKGFRRVQVNREDLPFLPRGFLLSHDRSPNRAHWGMKNGFGKGHTAFSLGNGLEASDHITKLMTQHPNGGTVTILMPVTPQSLQKAQSGMSGGTAAPSASASMPPIVINVDARGAQNPAQVKQQVREGANEAFSAAATKYPQATYRR